MRQFSFESFSHSLINSLADFHEISLPYLIKSNDHLKKYFCVYVNRWLTHTQTTKGLMIKFLFFFYDDLLEVYSIPQNILSNTSEREIENRSICNNDNIFHSVNVTF